jgi:hypothetical protein
MTFPYYRRLSSRQKAIYRASDEVVEILLANPAKAKRSAAGVRRALQMDGNPATQRKEVARAANSLVDELCRQLAVDPVKIKVLTRRPSYAESELHGLYTFEKGKQAQITVWMRTAAKRQVVAYRTFLRTLLHEVIHHLDYRLLSLADSFHTEGFFKRESSLARQLLGDRKAKPKTEKKPKPKTEKKPKPGQLKLPFE